MTSNDFFIFDDIKKSAFINMLCIFFWSGKNVHIWNYNLHLFSLVNSPKLDVIDNGEL